MAKKLYVGQSAPDFTTEDVFNNPVSLSAFKQKNTLVVFLRYSGCPWCNLAIHRLTVESKLLNQNGCEIIAFIQSTKDNIIQNIYHRHMPRPQFHIIADPIGRFYKLYDVKTSVKAVAKSIAKLPYWLYSAKELGFKQGKIDGSLLTVPAVFLIGEGQQTILHASYSTDFYDNESFTDIYQKLIFDTSAAKK